ITFNNFDGIKDGFKYAGISGAYIDYINDIKIDSQDRIIAAVGDDNQAGGPCGNPCRITRVTRYDVNGQPDLTFNNGVNHSWAVNISSEWDEASALYVDSNDHIWVTGILGNGNYWGFLACIVPGESTAITYCPEHNAVSASWTATSAVTYRQNAIDMDSKGRIVTAGWHANALPTAGSVARWKDEPDDALINKYRGDFSFGANAVKIFDAFLGGTNNYDEIVQIAVAPDDKIYATGWSFAPDGSYKMFVTRLNK
ncbi:MAG: hypothetical protein OEZ13_05145, partial [Spirochaetia bacterium]|nr:hypothetical protein [Spirochaetia bacterium]